MARIVTASGDLEMSVNNISAEKGTLLVLGRFGAWEGTVQFTPSDIADALGKIEWGKLMKLPFDWLKHKKTRFLGVAILLFCLLLLVLIVLAFV